jgi:hypothetical protein
MFEEVQLAAEHAAGFHVLKCVAYTSGVTLRSLSLPGLVL